MHPVTPTSSFMIPPELFPLIATFIPLRSAPQTLRSLALGNHRFYDIVRPLLYSRLILRNEDDAITVIQKILDEPHLGFAVTELYIMAKLSIDTRKGKKPFDVLVGLQTLVERSLVPRITALGIYLLQGWRYDENYNLIMLHGRLLADFWRNLRKECPRLRSLTLRNIGHGPDDPWLSGPVIDEINNISGLSVLRLEWDGVGLAPKDNLAILNNLPRLLSSLHTLSLESRYHDPNVILSLDFLNLKWLTFNRFDSKNEKSKIMDFFRRHPQLESLSLLNCMHAWFSDEVEEGFLPNLKHLKARFVDIRILVPILPQVVSLAFVESYNAQVPYLLRAILPDGLPYLKSLEIHQALADWDARKFMEGVQWYETLDGKFHIEKRRKIMSQEMNFMMNGYLNSVIKGAPNLEELGLHGMVLDSKSFATLVPTISQLVHMERFYYRGISADLGYANLLRLDPDEELAKFLASAEALARMCACLTTVTSINGEYLPYIAAKIERDSSGNVTDVRRSDGVGMLVSANENDPFPRNT